jgi:hypothetical protein
VPELLNTHKPVKAAQPEAALPKAAKQLAGCGAGAHARSGALAGALVGGATAGRALPRLPWSTVPADLARGGYQPISRMQFDQMTLINPVNTGGLGPHPAREPEPV